MQNIHPTALVHPGAVLAQDVVVGPYAVIEDNVTIGARSKIGPHAVIRQYVEMGEDNEIYQSASIGEIPQDLKFGGEKSKLIIGNRNRIREFTTINRGTEGGGGATVIGDDCFIMVYAHIPHDCHVGNHVIIANSVQIGGHVHIDEHAIIGGLTGLHQFVRIGAHSMVGACSAVSQDVPPFMNATGNRATLHGLNVIGLSRRGFSKETISALKKAYQILFRSGLTVKEAVEKASDSYGNIPEVKTLLEFVASSERGVCR